jgi:uncharacterized protein DUF2510
MYNSGQALMQGRNFGGSRGLKTRRARVDRDAMYAQPARPPRSGTTTIAAIIHFVLSGLVLLVAGIFLLLALAVSGKTSSSNKDLSAVLAIVVFAVVAIAIAFIFVGVQFVRGHAWARWALVVLYGFGLLSSIARIGSGGTASFGVLIDITMLVLLFAPSTARDFDAAPVGPVGMSAPPLPSPPVGGAIPGPPPGWYPESNQPGALRYWDGTTWTSHTAPAGPGAPQ